MNHHQRKVSSLSGKYAAERHEEYLDEDDHQYSLPRQMKYSAGASEEGSEYVTQSSYDEEMRSYVMH